MNVFMLFTFFCDYSYGNWYQSVIIINMKFNDTLNVSLCFQFCIWLWLFTNDNSGSYLSWRCGRCWHLILWWNLLFFISFSVDSSQSEVIEKLRGENFLLWCLCGVLCSILTNSNTMSWVLSRDKDKYGVGKCCSVIMNEVYS